MGNIRGRLSAARRTAVSPAPASTRTSHPAFARVGIEAGMRATRRSPGKVSLGTPTIIAGPDFLSFHNTHYADRRARSNWKSLTRVRHGRRLALWSVFGG